jgi:hypothetical protein
MEEKNPKSKHHGYCRRGFSMSVKDRLDELGICRDTVIIEIEGGVLKDVHNTPNDYVLFDWDNIKEEGETINKEGELLLMLETLQEC